MTPRTSIFARARLILIATLAAGLTLTACGNSGQSQAEQSASPTASASATATPSPTAAYKPADSKGKAQNVPVPVLPEAAKANSKEGVEAFARYWYDLLNYGFETGQLGPIREVTNSTCAMCGKVFPGIEKWSSNGRWIVGSEIQVQAVTSKFAATVSGEYQVAVQSQQSAGTLHNADGSVGQSVAASGVLGDLVIARYVDGRWFASNVDRLGS
ncbi:DUF6318 family protein [Arthrobacter sp. AZCC_0090]|uniref:DUF6318 family protein n=1 Tax=Arthrobacter sp. AZCC_0090 TaxID=2735881 RepID=UPI0017D25FE3|nr:hypothetical protein [Arthrobacter sp. AZCC_0090]